MPADVQELIQSLVRSSYQHEQQDSRELPEAPLVTVSRDYGAGGNEIGRRLGDALGVSVWDREILDAVAQAANSNPELMARLDDKVRTGRDNWMYNLLSGQNAFMTSYRHHLVNVVLAIVPRGGVIIGRGAHLILANRRVFRLRVIGSADACARRIAGREQLDYEQALAKVHQVNKEREAFMQNAFGRHLDEPGRFDLTLNSDKFDEKWDELTALVLSAIELAGLGRNKAAGK